MSGLARIASLALHRCDCETRSVSCRSFASWVSYNKWFEISNVSRAQGYHCKALERSEAGAISTVKLHTEAEMKRENNRIGRELEEVNRNTEIKGAECGALKCLAFGGGARYGARGQVFLSLLKLLHATGVSLDPMDDCTSCAHMNWTQYAAN